ncbi:histidine phosphatase family protein [Aedoeadaptatus coli]|uniref:histidine phosphatase family protein n=1 Tax=Aedoeadaptatus coli TaxID=2058292 RepID=UPI000D553E04|nr:histidine phosphatase family protein [Peptoniphilus coli]
MKLYILRHAETEWNRADRIQGQMDSPITREGEEAMAAMAVRLASVPFDCCYTSDLPRARKTAEGLLKFRPVPIIEEEALRELPLGPWEGMLFKEILNDPLAQAYLKAPETYHREGFMDFHDLYDKLRAFIGRLEGSGHEHVLIVGHGVSIRALYHVIEGVAVKDFWSRPIAESMGLGICAYEKGAWHVLRRADREDGLSY